MTDESKLEQAFHAYVDFARAELRPARANPSNQRTFRLMESKSTELRRLVAEIESSSRFSELVEATATMFPRKIDVHPLRDEGEVPVQRIDIENFFRRSRCYMSMYSGIDINIDGSLRDLIAEFGKEQVSVRRLVPLRYIQFDREQIEFDGFKIRRFSAEELTEILQNDVSDVFYQGHTVDVSEIEQYWFVDFVEIVESSSYQTWRLHFAVGSGLPVRKEFSAFPQVIAGILEPLVLYDWDAASNRELNPFDIPFVLETADDLLRAPRSAPDIPPFEMVGVPDENGEDVFEPIYKVDMDDPTLVAFHGFVSHMDSILTSLRKSRSEWHFLEVALLFLSRAFFSEGAQQLLWHMTALESLLGEKKEGLTNLLAKRLGSVLGGTEQERKEIRKSFQDLYELRSRLVHGDEQVLDQRTRENHLREARSFTRRTLVWFLHYLEHVHEATRNIENVPTREELLSMLDLKVDSRGRVEHLLKILPPDFPHKSGWLDQ